MKMRAIDTEIAEIKLRLGENKCFLSKNEITEMLPNPTPLSFTFFSHLLSLKGATGIAISDFGLRGAFKKEVFLVNFLGQVYSCSESIKNNNIYNLAIFEIQKRIFFKTVEDSFFKDVSQHLDDKAGLVLDRLSNHELRQLIEETITRLNNHYSKSVQANLLLNYCAEIVNKNIPNGERYFSANTIANYKKFYKDESEAVNQFAFFADHEFELSQPRIIESEDRLKKIPVQAKKDKNKITQEISKSQLKDALRSIPLYKKNLIIENLKYVEIYSGLKEKIRITLLRDLYFFRQLLLETGSRFFEDKDDIFYVELGEMDKIFDLSLSLDLIDKRKEKRNFFKGLSVNLPNQIDINNFTGKDLIKDKIEPRILLSGNWVSGSSMAGEVFVIKTEDDLPYLKEGAIVVCNLVSPAWIPYYNLFSGIIMEGGSALSHPVIVAREFEIPVLIKVSGALKKLNTGNLIKVGSAGEIIVVNE